MTSSQPAPAPQGSHLRLHVAESSEVQRPRRDHRPGCVASSWASPERLLWGGLRNASGLGIRDIFKAEIETNKVNPGRLATRLRVVHVFEEVSLSESLADCWTDPPEGDPVDDNLDTLSVLHSENPVARETSPL